MGNAKPWVAYLARFQAAFCVEVKPRRAAGHNCSSKANKTDY